MSSIDHVENQENNSHLFNYVSKLVELDIIKDVLSESRDMLKQKRAALEEESKELDNINNSVWTIENKFCDVVWNFSIEHDFHEIFNMYPNTKKIITPHKCKYNSAMVDHIKNMEKTDVDKEDIIKKLEDEIDIVNNEITDIRNKNIEQHLENAISVLNNLKSFCDEISELIRLMNTQENSLNVCNVPMYQQLDGNMAEGFINANKLFNKATFHSHALVEKKIISNTIFQSTKESYNIQSNIKSGKFVMKKRSLISLRFQQNPKNST